MAIYSDFEDHPAYCGDIESCGIGHDFVNDTATTEN